MFCCALLSIGIRTSFDLAMFQTAEISLGALAIFAFVFGLTLCIFAVMHILLVRRNQTTLEDIKRDHRWDLGSPKENWRELMGSKTWTWFFPIAPDDVGDGLEFGVKNV